MKIRCHREGLLAACQLAAVAIAPRDVKPVLRNIKAIVDEDRCTLMATDLELGIRLEVRGINVDEPGSALLPTARLIAILREATDEEMTIEASPDKCVVKGDTNEFDMPNEDPAAFPDVPAFAEEKYHEIAAGVLREMIKRTVFAAATEGQVRFGATTGVLWELEDEKASLIATDGRRLAMMTGPAKPHGGHSTKGQSPVVPAKAMSLLERNLTDPGEIIRIAFRQNEVLMKTDRAMIYSRLVEGRFPNYKQVIPSKHTHRVPLTVGPFNIAVRQAAIMTDDESKRVRFQFAKKKLTLRAQGAESGQSRVELPIDYDGKGLEISFDPKFLNDMLRVLEPDTPLIVDMNDSAAPAVFRHEPNYLYVLVPLVETK
ncbi:MAG: DNA polymerase III subunit beta [Planctomycetes bacterium]|nr:DNA polymerase III subunit beta [Planctomycetota bacterium]